jgi:hypothetical protein
VVRLSVLLDSLSPSVFFSSARFPLCFPFFPFEIVFGKKAFGLCFRIPLLRTKTMMVRVLVLRVGWTQAFSGSCPDCLSPLLSVSCFSSVFFFFVLSSFFLSIFFVLCILPSPGSFSPSVFVLLFFFPQSIAPPKFFPLFPPSSWRPFVLWLL